MKNYLLVILIACCCTTATFAQNVGINTTGATPNSSAGLDVDFTNKGLLIPRVALTSITDAVTITTPANSLLVYNTNASITGGQGTGYYYNSGTTAAPLWIKLTAANEAWLLKGNSGITSPAVPVTYGTSTIGATENWMGTTDANDVVFGTNFLERMRIKQTTGYVGIGMANPFTRLNISGGNWDVENGVGDFHVGDGTYRFKLGLATAGAGAGDVRMSSHGGTNRIFIGGGTNSEVITVDGTNQRVGIKNNISPSSVLDIAGDIALKEGTAMTVAAGNNALTLTGEYSHYRLTGAAGAFAINTITGGNDGQILTLINAASQVMTINNNNAANGILTGTGANLVSENTSNNVVTFIYNATLARWVVTSHSGMESGNDWHITGNTGIGSANFLGTINNADLKFRTNNTEKANLTTNGILAVGNATMGMNPNITGYDLVGSFSNGYGYITTHSIENATYADYFANTKARGTGAAPLIVQNGDYVGGLFSSAYDGANYQWMTNILSNVDGVPAAGNMPGRLTFGTSPAGSSYPLERMRITNIGNVGINTTNPTSKLHVHNVADANKTTTYSYASQNATNTDYDNIGVMGLGKGGNATWGYGAGLVGIGDQANSYYAQGVYAGLGSSTPTLPTTDAALYVDANDLGLAAHFREGSVVVDGADQNNGAVNYGIIFGTASGEGIGSKRTATGNQYGLDFYQGYANRMRIWNDGKVGIGQNSVSSIQPTHKLWVKDPSAVDADINMFSARNSGAAGSTWEMGSVEYYTEGYDNIGFSSWVSPLGSNGASSLGSNFGSNYDGWRWGTLYANNGVINTSDTTLKNNIKPISYGLKQIRQIDPITYTWKEDRKYRDFEVPEKEKLYHLGFNAQQLKDVIPEVVESWGWLHDKEKDYKKVRYNELGVNYAEITPVVVNAVKELDQTQQKIVKTINISDFGMATLNSNQLFIAFNSDFKKNLSQLPVVTVTALQKDVSLYIYSITSDGFIINLNGTLTEPVLFNWIAMGKLKEENLTTDYAYSDKEHLEKLAKLKSNESEMPYYKEILEKRKSSNNADINNSILTPEQQKAKDDAKKVKTKSKESSNQPTPKQSVQEQEIELKKAQMASPD